MTEGEFNLIWSKFIEPGLVISFFLFLFYLINSTYFYFYFDRFSFPYQGLNLPMALDLSKIIFIVFFNVDLIFLMAFVIMTLGFSKFEIDNISFSLRILGFFYLLTGLILMLSEEKVLYEIFNSIYILTPFITISIPIFLFIRIKSKGNGIKGFLSSTLECSDSKLSIFRYLIKRLSSSYIFVIILFLVIIAVNLFIIWSLAYFDATRVIEGGPGSYEVKLDKNNSFTNLPNTQLILLMKEGDDYYLIEKNSLAPYRVPLYIVPARNINAIVITKV